jgi:plasmid stabilization system protein ParE
VQVVVAKSAITDLESIADWIATDSPERAISFILLLRGRCLQLGACPSPIHWCHVMNQEAFDAAPSAIT